MLSETLNTALTDLLKPNPLNLGQLAVAFSGGGDSTALLYSVIEWARVQGHSRPKALIVDHSLREGSGAEARLAAKRASAMGAEVEILSWSGDKPKTGVQEKARMARYSLLGKACRQLGCTVLLLGHNRDDQAETLLMRSEKSSGWRGFGGMSEVRHAPLWPELYTINVLRPLLACSRAEIRSFNQQMGLSYIDDPSNNNLAYGRIKARKKLGPYPEITDQFIKTSHAAQIALGEEKTRIARFIETHIRIHDWGGVSVPRASFTEQTPDLGQVLKYLILAVSGRGVGPSEIKLDNLAHRLIAPSFKAATLGGVHIKAKNETLYFVRDPGALSGRSDKPQKRPQAVRSGEAQIWDGRFWIKCDHEGVEITLLGRYVDQLNRDGVARYKKVPHFARASLPAFVCGEKLLHWGLSPARDGFGLRYLAEERLCGLLS